MDTNTIIIIAGIAWFLGFWTLQDIIKGIVEIRQIARGETPVETSTPKYTQNTNDVDWDEVNKLKKAYSKMSVKKLKKLSTTSTEERIAKSVTLKKGGKL